MRRWGCVGLLLGVLLGCGTGLSSAVTIPAASCSDAHVQAAINSSTSATDIVTVPAGNCTWNTTVVVDGKGLTVRGAGIGQTTITDNGDQNAALMGVNLSAANFLRVTGLTFIQSKAHSTSGIVSFMGAQGAVAFRFDHSRILITFGPARGVYAIMVYGLIDNNVLDVTAPSGSVQMLTVDGAHAGADAGFTPWNQPLALGTAQAVYVEDNVITFGSEDEDFFDAYTGARIVFRHNTVTNAAMGFHGTDSGSLRSLFSVEQYSNSFVNNGTQVRSAIRLRGGTGVMWNNTFGGSKGYGPFIPMIYRATVGDTTFTWGYCDGTQWDLGSVTPSEGGSRQVQAANTGVRWLSTAPDTLCASGGTCTRYFDGPDAKGYPCRDQPGRTHNQALAPLYAWDNGTIAIVPFDGNTTYPPNNVGTPLSYWLAENRDYYNYQTSFTGTVGTGQGPLSARPATCTPLVAYWATDMRILYQCATPNTWQPYYQPYAYPHPLTGTGQAVPLVR
jgi:hypothetical protein